MGRSVVANCTQIHLCFIWANISQSSAWVGPRSKAQTDYIMLRPQGNPSGGCSASPGAWTPTTRCLLTGQGPQWQCQPHLAGPQPGLGPSQQPPSRFTGPQHGEPGAPPEPPTAGLKDPPPSPVPGPRGLPTAGSGRGLCQPSGHLLVVPPSTFPNQRQSKALPTQSCSTDGP